MRRLADTSPDEKRASFARVSETIGQTIHDYLERRARPLMLTARDHVVAVVDAEITRVSEAAASLYAPFGVRYVKESDPLVRALLAFRDTFTGPLCREGFTPEPKMIRDFIGKPTPLVGKAQPAAPAPARSTKLKTANEAALATA